MKLNRVLFVTANALQVNILKKQFDHWNIQVDIFQQTSHALEALRSDAYDLALLEQGISQVDAIDAARQIRALTGNEKLPMILVAEPGLIASLDNRDRLLFQAILPSPLNHADLRNSLNELIGSGIPRPAGLDVMPPATVTTLPSLNILVAEDNMMSQLLIRKLLENAGYKADLVADGLQAINACETKSYHFVFMDMQMPEMDGVEASTIISSRFPSLPVIIALTASSSDEDRQLCLNAGMKDFLQKPVSQNELREKIEKWKAIIEDGSFD